MDKPIRTPGPDHPITLTREPARVRVLFHGHTLGESINVIDLQEADYPMVRYFPRADIDTAFLRKTARTTYCPYKGEASYFTINRDADLVEDGVWSYETPYPAMAQIAGRLAFHPQHVTFEVEPITDGEVDRVIKHTDSGAGRSQEAPWPPTTSPDAPDSPPYLGVGSI